MVAQVATDVTEMYYLDNVLAFHPLDIIAGDVKETISAAPAQLWLQCAILHEVLSSLRFLSQYPLPTFCNPSRNILCFSLVRRHPFRLSLFPMKSTTRGTPNSLISCTDCPVAPPKDVLFIFSFPVISSITFLINTPSYLVVKTQKLTRLN